MSGIDFTCDDCGQAFVVPFAKYRGQFDHPPSVPICDDCAERINSDYCPHGRPMAERPWCIGCSRDARGSTDRESDSHE